MPTKIEALNFEPLDWKDYIAVPPGKLGVLTQNLPEGERVVYGILCDSTNSKTVISRAEVGPLVKGLDVFNDKNIVFDVITVRQKGDRPYVLTFKPDGVDKRQVARISHE